MDKRDKFKELAEKRVNKAINVLRLIGNLSNKSNYSYESADVDKIFKALSAELREMKGKFDRGGLNKRDEFKL